MAIKQAQYNITNVSGEDIYHFQTDDKMVKILDANNNEIGTLEELGFSGKIVEGGSFKDIKHTGMYAVKNVTGLPVGFAIDKISILSVKSTAKNSTVLDMYFYELFGQSGEIYNNAVIGTTERGWTDGGANLKNTITQINNKIGDLQNLKTGTKTSVVGSLNSLKDEVNSNKSTLSAHYDNLHKLNEHNHDEQYIKKVGDGVHGDLVLRNGRYISGRFTSGAIRGLVSIDENNYSNFGDKGSPMRLYGYGNDKLTYNDKKVWTEYSMGSGSGLDADRLDGIESGTFARRDTSNTFAERQRMNKGLDLYSNNGYSRILHKKSDGTEVTGLVFEDAGRVKFQLNGSENDLVIETDGKLVTYSDIMISSETNQAGLKFRRWSTRKGKGFDLDMKNESLNMYDWDNGNMGFSFKNDGTVEFQNAPRIQGRKLFIQASAPTGSKGDIWIDI